MKLFVDEYRNWAVLAVNEIVPGLSCRRRCMALLENVKWISHLQQTLNASHKHIMVFSVVCNADNCLLLMLSWSSMLYAE